MVVLTVCHGQILLPGWDNISATNYQPGESLEESVRRETWEETGIEVGQVIYQNSQPLPGNGLAIVFGDENQ